MVMTKFVSDWLARADEDMRTAALILKEKGPSNQICFHSQQAAEKYLKSFLAFHEKYIRKIHDLDNLVAECCAIDDSFKTVIPDSIYLTQFYIGARYPADMPNFTFTDGTKAFESAKKIKDFVINKIG